jgi:hypothetical protein
MEAANPEQRLSLNGHIAKRLRELGRTLEQSQFFRLLAGLFRVAFRRARNRP